MTTVIPDQEFPARARRAENLLIAATFVTFLGNNIQLIAASLLVYKAAGSALSVGYVFILVAVPQVLLSAVFGRIADRVDRRRLCVVTDVISALVAAGLPISIMLGLSPSVAAYVVSLGLATLAAIFMPASNALIKERVLPKRYGSVSANYELAYQGGALISGVLGGVVAQFVGLTPLFYANAATFLLSAVCLLAIGRRPVPAGAPAAGETTGEAGTAASAVPVGAAVARTPILRLGMLFGLGTVIVTVANTLLLVAVVDRFKQGASVLGIADALAMIGMLLAVLFYKKIKDVVDYRYLVLIGYVGCAGLALVQPIALWTLLVGIFFGGMTYALGRVPTRTEMMRGIDESRAGRVFGAANAFGLAGSVVVTVVVSVIVDRYGVVEGYLSLAALAGIPALILTLSLFARPAPGATPASAPGPGPAVADEPAESPAAVH